MQSNLLRLTDLHLHIFKHFAGAKRIVLNIFNQHVDEELENVQIFQNIAVLRQKAVVVKLPQLTL